MDRRRFIGSLTATGAATGAAVFGIQEYRVRSSRGATGGAAIGQYRPPNLTSSTLLWRAETTAPVVALTFDDGPDSRYTPEILDILEYYDATATFFMQGEHAATYPELVRRVAASHEIGNHTYTHANLTGADAPTVRDELRRTHTLLEKTADVSVSLFRPPYGHFSGAGAMIASGMGYDIILWSARISSHVDDTPAKNMENLRADCVPGTIVLAHDGGTLHNSIVVETLPHLLDHLRDAELRTVTVGELLRLHRNSSRSHRDDDPLQQVSQDETQ